MQADNTLSREQMKVGTRALIAISGLSAILALLIYGPIPQDLLYHGFADQRTLLNIPHAMDVLSNVPFCLFGLLGIYTCIAHRAQLSGRLLMYLTFFAAIFMTGFGSSYYHLNPDNETLVWDRLPMAVGFMAIFAAVMSERVDAKLAYSLFPWLVIAGVGSVIYWAWLDDLRPYILVQFGTMLALPAMILLYRRFDSNYLWLALAFYVLAKVLEFYDPQIFGFTEGWVSGHSLKHLAASLTSLMIALKVVKETGQGKMEEPQ